MYNIGVFAPNKRQTTSRHAINAKNNTCAIKSGGACTRVPRRAPARRGAPVAAGRGRTPNRPCPVRPAGGPSVGVRGDGTPASGQGPARRPAACARRLACAMRRSGLALPGAERLRRGRIMRGRHARRICREARHLATVMGRPARDARPSSRYRHRASSSRRVPRPALWGPLPCLAAARRYMLKRFK